MREMGLRELDVLELGLREMGSCPVSASGATCRACSDAGADRHMVKRTLPVPKAMPTRAFNISVNPHYPLLSTAQAPLPFVKPADVMPPTSTEADLSLACGKNNLPVVTSKSLSAPVVLQAGMYRMPDRVVIGTLLQSPVPRVFTALTGTMGPPPRPVKN
jgi:hypothetical protein